ncbi:hypothetical protein A5N17_06770 [Arthrobacter sp. D2]|nr:hypothetical protein [Arthrobacter sp. M5]NKR17160.1 hypothetical protein [Arthrobacter sp. M6]OEH61840.1 hypothetical protein A5N13_15790 [Arthrobacter sp. D4]OEH64142.1 hypothetical protein A5N17_06770 [Arthrobacter sp. D2]
MRHRLIGLAVILATACALPGCASGSTKSDSSTHTPKIEYADSATTQKVLDACTKHMSIYAANKYSAVEASVTYESQVRKTSTKWDKGFAVDLTVNYRNKSGLKGTVPLYCSVEEDFTGPRFDRRSGS